MKIVHVYAKNLQMFIDAVKDTDCHLNASSDINYLLGSLQNYNARDVVGLVVFANPMTKKCLELIRKFDNLFVFKRMPIIVINDNATGLKEKGYFKVNNSELYVLNSEENSISDLDICSIFVTLLAYNDSIYDLSVCPLEHPKTLHNKVGDRKELVMSEELNILLKDIEEGKVCS